MGLISFRPYREGSAVILGFGIGLLLALLAGRLAVGLCLGVGAGAVIDGLWRIGAVTSSERAKERRAA